jgi:hypothetical protein
MDSPTLGVYTSILYRAIRRGALVPSMSDTIGNFLTGEDLCLKIFRRFD